MTPKKIKEILKDIREEIESMQRDIQFTLIELEKLEEELKK